MSAVPSPKDADLDRLCLTLAFPKSGRTWLGHLYAYYVIATVDGVLAEARVQYLDTFYRAEQSEYVKSLVEARQLPRMRFANQRPDGPVPYYELKVDLRKFRNWRITFLVRDPRDMVVSYYHHVMSKAKVPLARDTDIAEFIRSELLGIRYIVAYLNSVYEAIPQTTATHEILRYEDLVRDTEATLARYLQFAGFQPVDAAAVRTAVELASFTRLQTAELARRRRAGHSTAPEDLRFRKGRVGGHAAELRAEDVAYLERVISDHLVPALRDLYPAAGAGQAGAAPPLT